MATRDQEKSKAAIERLEKETGNVAHFLLLDLADLDSVKESAKEFKRHVLFVAAMIRIFNPNVIVQQGARVTRALQ